MPISLPENKPSPNLLRLRRMIERYLDADNETREATAYFIDCPFGPHVPDLWGATIYLPSMKRDAGYGVGAGDNLRMITIMRPYLVLRRSPQPEKSPILIVHSYSKDRDTAEDRADEWAEICMEYMDRFKALCQPY